jgi:hypothetical protein
LIKVFYLTWFLIGGQWHPGTDFDGWAIREAGTNFAATEIDKKMASCEIGQALMEEINKELQKKPEGAKMPGIEENVHGVYAQCMKISFPQ